jgi:hypothetical protein
VRPREMFGAGAITAGARAGAINVRSRETSCEASLEMLGAGGIGVVVRVGPVSERSRDTEGAGAITESS